MKLYSCRVRLSGSLHHVQPKTKVTAAEMALLSFIHSQSENANQPVIDVVEIGTVTRTDAAERARLSLMYSLGEISGARLVQAVLGVAGVPLPTEYVPQEIIAAESAPLVGEEEMVLYAEEPKAAVPVETPAEPIVRTHVRKPRAPKPDAFQTALSVDEPAAA